MSEVFLDVTREVGKLADPNDSVTDMSAHRERILALEAVAAAKKQQAAAAAEAAEVRSKTQKALFRNHKSQEDGVNEAKVKQHLADVISSQITVDKRLSRSESNTKKPNDKRPKVPSEAQVMHILVAPSDPRVAFLVGRETMNWVTADSAATFRAVSCAGRRFRKMRFHPHRSSVLLASTQNHTNPTHNCDLRISSDMGLTWATVSHNVVCATPDWVTYSNVTDQICAVMQHRHNNLRDLNLKFETDFACFSFNSTAGKVGKPGLVEHGHAFHVVGKYIMPVVAQGASQSGRPKVKLSLKIGVVEENRIQYKNFDLPREFTSNQGYDIQPIEGQHHHALLIVHDSGSSGSLIYMDLRMRTWKLLMNDLHLDLSASTLRRSVKHVRRVEGRLLVNRYRTDSKQTWIQTTVSSDFGNTWTPVVFPEFDKKYPKQQHLVFSDNAPVVASEMSPGVVIASAVKQKKKHFVTTVISRDGGVTWHEVQQACSDTVCRNAFSFVKSGGVMTFIHTNGAAGHLLYTPDHGATWHKSKLPRRMSVDFMSSKSEPGNDSVVVIGQHKSAKLNDDDLGEIVFVDFSQLWQRRCFGEKNPGMAGSDFELWRPHATTCFLGRKTEYIRRAVHQSCLVVGRLKSKRQRLCQCVKDDYECLPSPEGHTAKCVPPSTFTVEKPSKADLCRLGKGSELVVGYKLLDGDTCKGGMQLPASPTDCVEQQQQAEQAPQPKPEEHDHKATISKGFPVNAAPPRKEATPVHQTHHSTHTLSTAEDVKRTDERTRAAEEFHRHIHKQKLQLQMGIGIAIVLGILMLVLCVCWQHSKAMQHEYQRVNSEEPDGAEFISPTSLFAGHEKTDTLTLPGTQMRNRTNRAADDDSQEGEEMIDITSMETTATLTRAEPE